MTDAGVQAMMRARTNGFALQLQGFMLGSAFNYTFPPSTLFPPVSGVPYSNTSQNTLRGSQVYPAVGTTAPISNYHLQADGVTGAFSIVIGLTVGNFSFGEIAVVMPDGTIFGLANLTNLQPKTATVAGSTGNIIQISLTFQANGTIPVIELVNPTPTQANLLTVQSVDVVTSGPSGQPVNEILALNPDEYGRATELVEQSANSWQSSQYDWIAYSGTFPSSGTSSDKTAVDPNLAQVANFSPVTGRWLIRFNGVTGESSVTPPHGQVRQLTTAPKWAVGTIYNVGYVVQANAVPNPNAYFVCTTAGTSGSTEPSWPTTAGSTVTDGTVVWTYSPTTVNPNTTLTWNGSLGSATVANQNYDLIRASSFTGLYSYIEEYMMFRRFREYWHWHD